MSMNLVFITKEGRHLVDFPYQTSTDLTYAVFEKSAVEDQILLIAKDLEQLDDDEYKRQLLIHIEEMLRDKTLELEIM